MISASPRSALPLRWGRREARIHRPVMSATSTGLKRVVGRGVTIPGPRTQAASKGRADRVKRLQEPGCWDELLVEGHPRPACEGVVCHLVSLGDELAGRQEAAKLANRPMGITFTVYPEAANIDRSWPFDVILCVISTQEWVHSRSGPCSVRIAPGSVCSRPAARCRPRGASEWRGPSSMCPPRRSRRRTWEAR